jgi:hypothetical protein
VCAKDNVPMSCNVGTNFHGPPRHTGVWAGGDACVGRICRAVHHAPVWGYHHGAAEAFCALEPDPSPVCKTRTSACESATSWVACNLGYITSRRACLKCVEDEPEWGPDDPDEQVFPKLTWTGHAYCKGSSSDRCRRDEDCLPGLQCRSPDETGPPLFCLERP